MLVVSLGAKSGSDEH